MYHSSETVYPQTLLYTIFHGFQLYISPAHPAEYQPRQRPRGAEEEHRVAEAVHQVKAERRGAGGRKRRRHAEHSHALGEAGVGDNVGGDRRRRGVRQRKRRAVHHPEHKGEEDHRRGHIDQRHQHHPAQSYREDRPALSVVEHPADERAAEYRNE